MKKVFLCLSILFCLSSFAHASNFGQLGTGASLNILSAIYLPANQTDLKLYSSGSQWMCWLFFPSADKTRIISEGRTFRVLHTSSAEDYFGQATYVATLADATGKRSSLSIQCIDSKISYLNSIYRGQMKFTVAPAEEFP